MIVLAFSMFEAFVAVSANVFDLGSRPMIGCVDRLTKKPREAAAPAPARQVAR